MNSRSVVLDTEDTVFNVSGQASLSKETLDFVVRPQPKDMSILSLRTPLVIGGTFAAPKAGLEAGPLATRGAAALALGALNPLLALAATVETGPGVDADCQEVLARGQAAGLARGGGRRGQGQEAVAVAQARGRGRSARRRAVAADAAARIARHAAGCRRPCGGRRTSAGCPPARGRCRPAASGPRWPAACRWCRPPARTRRARRSGFPRSRRRAGTGRRSRARRHRACRTRSAGRRSGWPHRPPAAWRGATQARLTAWRVAKLSLQSITTSAAATSAVQQRLVGPLDVGLDADLRVDVAASPRRADSTLAWPTRAVLWAIWRCRLVRSTSSSSTSVMRPTPAAARYSATGEPSPPAPITSAWPALTRAWPSMPNSSSRMWRE